MSTDPGQQSTAVLLSTQSWLARVVPAYADVCASGELGYRKFIYLSACRRDFWDRPCITAITLWGVVHLVDKSANRVSWVTLLGVDPVTSAAPHCRVVDRRLHMGKVKSSNPSWIKPMTLRLPFLLSLVHRIEQGLVSIGIMWLSEVFGHGARGLIFSVG